MPDIWGQSQTGQTNPTETLWGSYPNTSSVNRNRNDYGMWNFSPSADGPSAADMATAPYLNKTLQNTLPPWLRDINTGSMLSTGMQGIAELLMNPGGVSSKLQEAIKERLGSERSNISQNYAGLQSEQAGAAARGNMPVQIKDALARALETNQRRAQGDATRGAIAESEELRRTDVAQTYQLLDTILQYMSSAKGQGIQGLQAAGNIDQTNNAANMALIASLAQGIGQAYSGGGD